MTKNQKYIKSAAARIILNIILFLLCFQVKGNENIEEIFYSKNLSNNEKYESISKEFHARNNSLKLAFSKELLELALDENNELWVYRAYQLMGNAYGYMADVDKAYECYLTSLNIASKNNFIEEIGDTYIGLGNVLSIGGEHTKAISSFKDAIKYLRIKNDSIYEGYTLLNIVNEFNILHESDSVIHYLELANNIFSAIDDDYGKAYVFGQKAIHYTRIGEIDLAEKNFDTCIVLLTNIGQIYDIVAFQTEMAAVLHKQKNPKLALKYTLNCYSKAVDNDLQAQIRDAAKLLSEIYNDLGNYKQAYKYQTEFINYKDSINNEETIRKMADLRAEYEISQKQVEVDNLQKERTINRIIIYSIAVFLIVLIILSTVLIKRNKIIKRQKAKLQEINDSKDKMFSIVSHDLRGPIHSMSGFLSLIEEMVKNKETDELLEMSVPMNQSLLNISSLLDNLLEWATNEQGLLSYNPEYFNAYSSLKALHSIFANSANVKGVDIILNVDENLKVFADKNTFSTIFRNLLGNAIKFTNKGDTITIESKVQSKNIIFSVSDTGIGISEKQLSTIFSLGNAKSTWGTANEKGIGLGLRLAQEFTELNKGHISVESREGEGTTFFVKIPMVEA